ncbi:hypothetical protein K456DRAFT_46256 [Colletotrichum gloeosporioides 23]|nr:hypothetical protein K456DRAFT_46256 [Colletotrichum gloeosporioides 23]
MAKHGYLHIHAIGYLQPLLGLLLPFIPSPAQLHFTVVASQSIRMEMGVITRVPVQVQVKVQVQRRLRTCPFRTTSGQAGTRHLSQRD